MQRGRRERMGRAYTKSPVRVRVHIRGTLNQAAFVAREPKSSAGSRARGRRKCTRSSPYFFFARGRPKRERRSFLPSSFTRSLSRSGTPWSDGNGRKEMRLLLDFDSSDSLSVRLMTTVTALGRLMIDIER